jgi:hypothetical protein
MPRSTKNQSPVVGEGTAALADLARVFWDAALREVERALDDESQSARRDPKGVVERNGKEYSQNT